ncbi:ATP-NAD kinase family protein [Primorskyibacter sp. 2E107]|uniref:ATP-NAD kinase family protein n=1 Tax=Primorskyibacter sp. 2E107 TaxID=3403458 RepID=UPI003AF7458C
MNRVGVVINPIAGLGGALAQKGSDAPDIASMAAALSHRSQAPQRAARAMRALKSRGDVQVFVGPVASACGGGERIAVPPLTGTAEDTMASVAAMQGKVDLILFAGGDGTARDICAANSGGVPILGIPSGVKMHSGVFARSPERAGLMAAAFLADPRRRTEMVEILDIDEVARRAGRLSAQLHCVARTPFDGTGARQHPKAGNTDTAGDLGAALAAYAARLRDDTLYVLGPGATMMALKDRIGGGTLLGVDVAERGQITATDLDEHGLLARVAGRTVCVVLTVVGGQGFVLGRGNQQISPAVLRAAGVPQIDVICGADKLAALRPPELTIDTGDPELDCLLAGYWPVITGVDRKQVMRVVA